MNILSQISGGYDSTAVMIKLLNEGNYVKGIFFNYGQKYYESEKDALLYIDKMLKKTYENYLGYEEVPVNMQLTRNSDGSPSDYIPIRNLVLGTLSANYALSNGYNKIAVGNKTVEVRENDPYSFADCSVSFYKGMSDIVNLASEPGDEIEFIMPLLKTPTAALTKGDVVTIIHKSVLEFSKLWSCYETNELPCGDCYHCKENKKAFRDAGIVDPVQYLNDK